MAQPQAAWRGRLLLAVLRLLILAAITAGLAFVIFRGLKWHGARGISDALFVVALGEMVIAGGSVWGSATATSGDLALRVLTGVREKPGSITHQQTIWADMLQRQSVAAQALLCGFVTLLISVAVSLLWG